VTIADRSRIGGTLGLYSLTGQKLMSVRITQLSFPINVASLGGGVYFVRIDGGKPNMVKLVKL